MAKKTDSTKSTKNTAAVRAIAKKNAAKSSSAKKVKAAPKGEAKPAGPRHPKARVVAKFKTKAELAKTVAAGLVREDEDPANLATTLATASNQQLLRLHDVVETVKSKFGSRAKLIAAIGTSEKKSKDKDFLTKLDSMPLPQLLALATQHAQTTHATKHASK